jgi:thiamine-phosphate pyrophosphorylase
MAEQVHRAEGVFIVNDRADVAALSGADGVHLGQDDLPPVAARALLGEEKLIGYSTHNREQVARAEKLQIDYIAIGPVFQTGTKENPDPVVGMEMVRRVRGLTAMPLVAIGGITLENAPSVLASGADAVAVISDLTRDSQVAERVRGFLSALPPRD